MNDVLNLIKARRSVRVPFDPLHPIYPEDLKKILDAGRWAPTAHNMQNYEIMVVDGPKVLESLTVTDEVKRTLGIPDRLRIVYCLLLGYPKTDPPEGPRVRRELGDFVHRNEYGNMFE